MVKKTDDGFGDTVVKKTDDGPCPIVKKRQIIQHMITTLCDNKCDKEKECLVSDTSGFESCHLLAFWL